MTDPDVQDPPADPEALEPTPPERGETDAARSEPHRIGVLLYHHVNELEVAGLVAAVAAVRRHLPEPAGLEAVTVARRRASVQTSGELTVTPAWGFPGAPPLRVLVVPGGPGVDRALRDRPSLAWLRERAATTELFACSGSGALLLGAAGLLRDRVVTTHPDVAARLGDYEVGEARVERLHLADEGVWSAGPIAAASELGLALAARVAPPDAVARGAELLGLEPPA